MFAKQTGRVSKLPSLLDRKSLKTRSLQAALELLLLGAENFELAFTTT